jgi:glycogen synthase
VLWKYPHPFSFPNGIRKEERLSILRTKTPGNHADSKLLLQKKYFQCTDVRKEVPLFAFIGRITRQKGVHLILEAA